MGKQPVKRLLLFLCPFLKVSQPAYTGKDAPYRIADPQGHAKNNHLLILSKKLLNSL